MKKIYLAHSISTTGEYEDSKRVANEIRKLGYDVYVASENDSINDKSNDPTPMDIYKGDITQLLSSDIMVVNISGGLQDGTISEVGIVAGFNEGADKTSGMYPEIPIIAYTSNTRLLQPQYYKGIPSANANHLVLGIVEKWGGFVGSEKDMLVKLREMKL